MLLEMKRGKTDDRKKEDAERDGQRDCLRMNRKEEEEEDMVVCRSDSI